MEIPVLRMDLSVQNLCDGNGQLEFQKKELYRQKKILEYASCNHIWVNAFHEHDCLEGRSYNYYGCIKCGLDERVFLFAESLYGLKSFTANQRIMYDFMKEHTYKKGIESRVLCDLDLAKAIYSKIHENHPDIDDELARKYFEIALHHIRENKVSDERRVSRAKRLALHPKFQQWNGYDVQSH